MINSCQLIYVLVLFTFFSSYSMQPVDKEDDKMNTLEDSFGRTSNGLYHIDDMILDGYEFQEMYGNGKSGNPNKRFRWPKREVPYE